MIYKRMRLLFAAILIAVLFAFTSAASAAILDGDHAYISNMSVSDIRTGSEPFDKDDTAGNDSNDTNTIVRTFDTVTYRLNLTLSSHNSASDDGKQFEEARIYFAFKIPYSSMQAQFNTASMAWMENGFRVEETADGQILYCSILKDEAPNYAVPGTQSVFVSLDIKNLKNGEIVTPEFFAWMEGNRVLDAGGKPILSQNVCPDHGLSEIARVTPSPVTVSAKMNLNVQLSSFSSSYNTYYNFNSGRGASAAYPAMNKGKGTHTGSGISIAAAVSVLNENVSKGMRGLEMPDGSPITFDIQLDTQYKLVGTNTYLPVKGQIGQVSYDFTPLVYSYGGYTYSYTNDDGRSVPQRLGLPDNVRKNSSYLLYACCNGGIWSINQEGNVLHLTISDYEIDGIFPRRNSPIVTDDAYKGNIGYIATSEFHFFMPHYNQNGGTDRNEDDYIAKLLGEGSFIFNVTAGNLKAKSQSSALPAPDTTGSVPDNDNQPLQNDDARSSSVYLTNPGSYSSIAAFSNHKGTNQYYPLTPDCFYDGRDWAFPGTEICITAGVWASDDKGSSLNRTVAFDNFLKIDANAISFIDRLTGSSSSNVPGIMDSFGNSAYAPDGVVDFRQTSMPHDNGQKIKILYAVKKDGTNWSSDDEMRQTDQESNKLLWYDNLQDATAAGKVVGLLFQYRGLVEANVVYPRFQVVAQINPDAETDRTYMITHELRIWNVNSLNKLGYLTPVEVTQNSFKEFYDKIPLRTPEDGSGYQNDLATYLNACCARFNKRYDRLVYLPNGSTTGSTTAYNYGDTVYVAPYSTQVDINPINSASTSATSAVYDMGAEQNIADFAITPIVSLPSVALANASQVKTDTITITQMLPSGLTYIPGSSTYGGTYVLSKHGQQGTVVKDEDDFLLPLKDNDTVSFVYSINGKEYPITAKLNILRKANGETVLEYVFTGVPLTRNASGENALSKLIRFSTEIDPNSVANWTLAETATIHGATEKSKISEKNGNIATTSILVYQNTAEGIGVKADCLYNEQSAALGWTITYTNASNMPRSDALLFVRMPEDRHTGSYDFTEWVLDLDALGADGDGLELWYTTADVKDKNASHYTRDQLAAQGSGFAKLELTEKDGKLLVQSIPEAAKHTSAWILTGPIGAKKTFSIHQAIKPEGNIPTDSYRTTAYFRADNNAPHSYATVYIVGRELSGLVWYDKNYNGIRDAGESPVSGVTVELYNGTEKVTHDVTGAELPVVVTNANGAYSLTKLSEGSYTVHFSGLPAEYNGITRYQVAGADAAHNSDAKKESDVIRTAPAVSASDTDTIGRNFTQLYTNLDLGLIKTGEIEVTKSVTGDIPSSERNRAFTFTLALTHGGAPYTQAILQGITSVCPDAGGKITFTLKAGETAVFSDIPADTAYTVSEANAAHYTPALANASGIVSDAKSSVSCVNSYLPDAASYAPAVTKALDGQTPPAAATFTFTLTHTGENTDGFTMPAVLRTTVTGTGSAAFGAVTFTKAGTYTFAIAEEAASAYGYFNDANGPWTLTVTVTDVNGTLTASPAYTRSGVSSAESATFTNTYTPDSTDYSIEVAKRIEGVAHQDETYTFEVLEQDGVEGKVRMPVSREASVTGAGTAAFDPIIFYAAGEYSFIVREIPGATDNCVYDSSNILVTITVTDINGKLSVTNVSCSKNGTACQPEFVNAYNTGHLSISKTVRENDGDLLKEWHFAVAFMNDDGSEFTLPLSYDGASAGTITSGGTLTLTHGQIVTIRNVPAGLSYTVTEVQANTDRYTTTSIGETGTITVNQTASAAFTNTFSPYAGDYSISVTKRIEGSPAQEETYAFLLTGEPGMQQFYTMPSSAEASVTGAGTATFEPITFLVAGEYRFFVQEIAGATANCTYDDSELTVTVTVTNVNGQLTVTKVLYEKNGEEAIPEFVNAYQAGSLSIVKYVQGNDGETDREWHFKVMLMDHNGEEYTTALHYDGSLTGTIVSGDTIALRHNEAVTIHSIPEGITYTVTETEANADGYTTTSCGAAGIIMNGKTAKAEFTNTRIKADVPQTGDGTAPGLLSLLLAASFVAFTAILRRKQHNP